MTFSEKFYQYPTHNTTGHRSHSVIDAHPLHVYTQNEGTQFPKGLNLVQTNKTVYTNVQWWLQPSPGGLGRARNGPFSLQRL